MTLPTPVGRQKEVLYLPAQGQYVVLGTAGSGKTVLAILRSAYLANNQTEHGGRTLLLSFNRTLVAYLKHLQDNQLTDVVVENYHKFARGYLFARQRIPRVGGICDARPRTSLIEEAMRFVALTNPESRLLRRPSEFFSEEIKWIAQQGIKTAEKYIKAPRIGRGDTRVRRDERRILFEVLQKYHQLRAEADLVCDWDDIASLVADELRVDNSNRRYKHIVIDEGQDFSPEMLRSLVLATGDGGSLTFFGDMAQQIYGHQISWREAGLTGVSLPWEFKENYRNTKQIARLALNISAMPYFQGVADLVEPVSPTSDGPLPTMVICSTVEKELDLVVKQAVQLSKSQSVAILFKNREDERLVSSQLPASAVRLDRELDVWQTGSRIYYGTYYSAKGLEFDSVILPFFSDQELPDSQDSEIFGADEAATHFGKLIYVAITRAKTRLIMTCTGKPTSLLPTKSGLISHQRVQ